MPYYRITYRPDTDEHAFWASQDGQQIVWADQCTVSKAETSARFSVFIARGRSGLYRHPVLNLRLRVVERIEEVAIELAEPADSDRRWTLTWEPRPVRA